MYPYQLCTKEECVERQELRQVSELEATVETCLLPQAERILDPKLAVTKYRRSAAGTSSTTSNSTLRNRDTLIATIHHLSTVCATCQATVGHPRVTDVGVMINFVVDRLRACQSDGTRLMGTTNPMPAWWHAQMIRIVIWIQFCSWTAAVATTTTSGSGSSNTKTQSQTDSLLPRTLHTIRSTAYEAYWGSTMDDESSSFDRRLALDDEMLCYEAVSKIATLSSLSSRGDHGASTSLDSSWNGMLLEFNRRRTVPTSTNGTGIGPASVSYPHWHTCIQLASHICRGEYFSLWRDNNSNNNNNRSVRELPILARCILCMSTTLSSSRYETVRQYNVSFAKGEYVSDLDRLLGIPSNYWSLDYAQTFGLPTDVVVSDTNEGRDIVRVRMKQVAMPDWRDYHQTKGEITLTSLDKSRCSDDYEWSYGKWFDHNERMGLRPSSIKQVLQSGCVSEDQEEGSDGIIQRNSNGSQEGVHGRTTNNSNKGIEKEYKGSIQQNKGSSLMRALAASRG